MEKFETVRIIMFLILIITESIRDIKTHQISIPFVSIFGIMGMITYLPFAKNDFISVFLGMVVGLSVLLVSFFSRQQIGYGDGFVMIVSGILLGFRNNMALLLGALIYSAMVGLALLIIRKADKKTELPFVPFILLSFISMGVIRWMT